MDDLNKISNPFYPMKPILINIPTMPKIEKLPEFEKDKLNQARRAAEAHKISRAVIINQIKPGISLNKICEIIETTTRTLLKGELNDGLGFPTGVSLNECAAHYSPNPGDDEIILKASDILKIDFGTHCDGRIMDSAFTICFDPIYENLLLASKEATEKALKLIAIDKRVRDIGKEVGEVISSYELEINNKTIPIKPVSNLNGHSIGQYIIHDGISIPLIDNGDDTKIEGDTFYACETFATTGNGIVRDAPNCSHYMYKGSNKKVQNQNNIKILRTIKSKIKTLPFCPRFIDYYKPIKSNSAPFLRSLSSLEIIEPYPPLNDIKDSLVSQFEHTLYLSETTKEILTKGEDY